MKYVDIPPMAREILGYHVAFLKLGFRGEDIFVHIHPNAVLVLLKIDGEEIPFVISSRERSTAQCQKVMDSWVEVCTAYSKHEISTEDAERIFQESKAGNNGVPLVTRLVSKGVYPRKKLA